MDSAVKPEWMARIFSEHRGTLEAFFRRRIRASMDAPDLAQEVYLRMLRVKDSDAIRNPEVYLYTVASNLVKEHALSERRAAALQNIDDHLIQDQLADLPRVDDDIDGEIRAQSVRALLQQLSPKCRAAVVLHYREHLTYEQIGQRLGVSSHMVKKYIVQALNHFRRRRELLR